MTELLEDARGPGIGFAGRGALGRLWQGQALHSRIQAAAAAGDLSYRSEVSLELRLRHAGWEVFLQGRADGIREDGEGGLVVEEIKSIRRGVANESRPGDHRRLQVALYAWMLHRERGLPVKAELLWVEIGSERIRRERVPLDFRALERALRARIDDFLERSEAESRERVRRRAAAGRVCFPHPSLRRGQGRMIESVESALERREHLLLEASTGIGKTVAVLFPALRFALADDKRVYVLTAKNLQQEIAMAALESLDPGGIRLAVRLQAKARMCASGAMTCHEESCAFARDFRRKTREGGLVRRVLESRSVVGRETLFEIAVAGEVCPYELGLAAAREAAVTVCDYNYAFDPVASLREFSPDGDLSNAILVVDEIHNLVERAREISSPSLDAGLIGRAERVAALGGAPIHRAVEALCRDLLGVVEETLAEAAPGAADESWSLEHALPAERLLALRPRLDLAFADYLEYRVETRSLEKDDAFLELCFAGLRFLQVLSDRGEGFAELVGRDRGMGRLRLLCLDPGKRLGAVLNRCHSVIGLSATLTPTDFHRDLLGLDRERSTAVAIGSPFPPEHRCLVIDTSVTALWRDRSRESPVIARRIAEFSEQVPGHCLAVLPSHAVLDEVAGLLPANGKRLLRQRREDGGEEREAILRALREPRAGSALLLAVAGGVFTEGIDYPGDGLRGVIVVGPCLPAPDLERRLLESSYQERFERGFDYAYAIPGMTRVVQAAGRLIRSERDSGVIALLGRRALREPYRSLLPDAWLGGRPPEDLVGDPAAVARRFFAGYGS